MALARFKRTRKQSRFLAQSFQTLQALIFFCGSDSKLLNPLEYPLDIAVAFFTPALTQALELVSCWHCAGWRTHRTPTSLCEQTGTYRKRDSTKESGVKQLLQRIYTCKTIRYRIQSVCCGLAKRAYFIVD